MSERMEKLVKGLDLQLIRAGGAGYKCVKLINKEVGSIIFIDAKTSKWDTCAGEAIIRAMGGFSMSQNLS
jgi:3'-phosphoadenosine 5'-phosphosulfate (PAPS) 3'-phosphatase